MCNASVVLPSLRTQVLKEKTDIQKLERFLLKTESLLGRALNRNKYRVFENEGTFMEKVERISQIVDTSTTKRLNTFETEFTEQA